MDCDLLAKIYINLIGQKEPTLNFQETNSQKQKSNEGNSSYYKKIVKPSKLELEKHKEYLIQNLKKNFFN